MTQRKNHALKNTQYSMFTWFQNQTLAIINCTTEIRSQFQGYFINQISLISKLYKLKKQIAMQKKKSKSFSLQNHPQQCITPLKIPQNQNQRYKDQKLSTSIKNSGAKKTRSQTNIKIKTKSIQKLKINKAISKKTISSKEQKYNNENDKSVQKQQIKRQNSKHSGSDLTYQILPKIFSRIMKLIITLIYVHRISQQGTLKKYVDKIKEYKVSGSGEIFNMVISFPLFIENFTQNNFQDIRNGIQTFNLNKKYRDDKSKNQNIESHEDIFEFLNNLLTRFDGFKFYLHGLQIYEYILNFKSSLKIYVDCLEIMLSQTDFRQIRSTKQYQSLLNKIINLKLQDITLTMKNKISIIIFSQKGQSKQSVKRQNLKNYIKQQQRIDNQKQKQLVINLFCQLCLNSIKKSFLDDSQTKQLFYLFHHTKNDRGQRYPLVENLIQLKTLSQQRTPKDKADAKIRNKIFQKCLLYQKRFIAPLKVIKIIPVSLILSKQLIEYFLNETFTDRFNQLLKLPILLDQNTQTNDFIGENQANNLIKNFIQEQPFVSKDQNLQGVKMQLQFSPNANKNLILSLEQKKLFEPYSQDKNELRTITTNDKSTIKTQKKIHNLEISVITSQFNLKMDVQNNFINSQPSLAQQQKFYMQKRNQIRIKCIRYQIICFTLYDLMRKNLLNVGDFCSKKCLQFFSKSKIKRFKGSSFTTLLIYLNRIEDSQLVEEEFIDCFKQRTLQQLISLFQLIKQFEKQQFDYFRTLKLLQDKNQYLNHQKSFDYFQQFYAKLQNLLVDQLSFIEYKQKPLQDAIKKLKDKYDFEKQIFQNMFEDYATRDCAVQNQNQIKHCLGLHAQNSKEKAIRINRSICNQRKNQSDQKKQKKQNFDQQANLVQLIDSLVERSDKAFENIEINSNKAYHRGQSDPGQRIDFISSQKQPNLIHRYSHQIYGNINDQYQQPQLFYGQSWVQNYSQRQSQYCSIGELHEIENEQYILPESAFQNFTSTQPTNNNYLQLQQGSHSLMEVQQSNSNNHIEFDRISQ